MDPAALIAPLRRVFVTSEGVLAATLAAVASLVCATTPMLGWRTQTGWYIGAGLGLLVYRFVFERVATGGGAVTAVLFVVHVCACASLVALHPLYGAYAFIGYVDAARVLRGWWRWLGTCAMAPVLAFSQVGGLAGRWATWSVFAVFVAVNVAIAVTMASAERARERHAADRLATAERLLDAERENTMLQARLAREARAVGILDERARLSREIHDTVAQNLVGIVRHLDVLDGGEPPRQWRMHVEAASEAARDGLAEARRAVSALASPRLDEDDLHTALERLCMAWSARGGVRCELVVDGVACSGAHDDVVLRVAQEALANVQRHAEARRVVITLTYGPAREDGVRIDVRDDGVGFDPDRVRRGHGLPGMRARVESSRGTWDVEAAPGSGCTLSVWVPLDEVST